MRGIRYMIVLVVFGLPLVLLSVYDSQDVASDAVTVTRVVDGDTLVVGKERIRISNVDAEEAGTPLGELATSYVKQLEGELVILKCDGQDKYGRELCLVSLLDGSDLGELLISQGLAERWIDHDLRS